MKQKEWEEKTEKYFSILYPDFNNLSPEEQKKAMEDKFFIIGNTEMIDKFYSDYDNPDSPFHMEGLPDIEKLKMALTNTKVESYFDAIYPDYENMPAEDQRVANEDKFFIISNTDLVHKLVQEFSNADSPRYMPNASKSERVAAALREAKSRDRDNIRPQDILKSALKSGTTREDTLSAQQTELETDLTKDDKGEIDNG